jgi:hypothetical protein
MRISVIIPCHNASAGSRRRLRSQSGVRAQQTTESNRAAAFRDHESTACDAGMLLKSHQIASGFATVVTLTAGDGSDRDQ